ncbi:MAG: helicase-related protein [Proteiniphilum sp.]|nr:helicase-related protein [Fermentimonas sp.]MDD4417058.1 helicase-related protein [Proteiniphilum sp.]
MDPLIITNQHKFLSKVIEDILPHSQKLYFLVGYFYFSGFEEIYTQLQDKQLKILIGMSIEKDLSNHIKEYYVIRDLSQSRLEIKKDYYSSLVQVFNDTDYFDSAERIKAFKLFLNKIQDGSLQIKKTALPNHAKMYLFEHSEAYTQGGMLPGTMITGSSNLTLSGLKNQHEINVVLYDKFKSGKAIFDDLWESAIDLVDENCLDDFTEEVIKKIWYEKLYKPYLFYVRVLDEYFSMEDHARISLPSKITKGKFFNLQYQIDAIKKSLKIIDEHNGVMICDVVGLGKSIIASAVAYNLHKKVIVIAPPHLKDQWDQDYRVLFELNAVVYGSGSIQKALEYKEIKFPDEEFLIIVDEAHKYRNEDTEDYILLHRLCQGNKVMLLTATPFNNRPQDVFAMVKLFQIPSKSTIRTVDNLSYHFAEAVKEYKEINKKRVKKSISESELQRRVSDLARKIRYILEPVVLRRSRLDLDKIDAYRLDLEKQGIRYVFTEPPVLKEYPLGDMAEMYLKTLDLIARETDSEADEMGIDENSGYIGARYKPANYIIDIEKFRSSISDERVDVESIGIAQANLAKFMQRLLVGRFESSLNAFKKTLESMIESMENIKQYYTILKKVPIFKKGQLPSVDDLLEDLNDEALAEISSYGFDEELKKQYDRGLVFIPAAELKPSFIIHLNHDLELLKQIHWEWFAKGMPHDPKLENFIQEIKRQIREERSRKIVVFSEYTDTASYVYQCIADDPSLRAIYYSSSESSAVRKVIKENFDASIEKQSDDYDILITTDALSEGINLNRAGTVFNYDIPYNPTRVIQRVGRINRIGKMLFSKLYIYNYFPTDIGEDHIRKKEISTLKKAMIDLLLGEDTRVLTKEEQLVSYFHEQYQKIMMEQEAESWDAPYLNEYNHICSGKPDLLQKARDIQHRSRLQRTQTKEKKGVIVFGKKGEDFAFRLGLDPSDSITLSPQEALSLFHASESEKPQCVSDSFDAIYQNAKANMYVKQSITAQTGKRAKTLNKLKAMIGATPLYKDYLQDLYSVAKDLNSLPDGVYHSINQIHADTLNSDVESLMKLVPHSYLNTIILAARKIDDGAETLILAEELI